MSNAGTGEPLASGVGLSMLEKASTERRTEFVQAVMDRGISLFRRGQFDSADVLFKTMEHEPAVRPLVQHIRGVIALHRGEDERALDLIEEAIRLNPTDADAHANLGLLLLRAGQHPQALAAYAAALTLRPDNAAARFGLARAFAALDLTDFAEYAFRDALAGAPDYVEAIVDFAALLNELGRQEEAATLLRDALARGVEHDDLHIVLAVSLFAMGEWPAAWAEYERRLSNPQLSGELLVTDRPRWKGEDLDGKTILLQSEQGFGDVIHFVRYAPMVKAREGRLILRTPQALLSLMRTVAGIDEVVSTEQEAPAFDVHAPLMSLPLVFATQPDTVPAEIPYVVPDLQLMERWRQQLGEHSGISVGLVWHGDAAHANDRRRSIPLDRLLPLLDCPGVRFVSLQAGPGQEQLRGVEGRIVDAGARIEATSFADAAAIIANLDLVISIDSTIAHLAGAIGKPVWILLPTSSDWRWLKEREDTAWYPQARLFRQKRPGDWAGVIEAVRAALWSYSGVDAKSTAQHGVDAITAAALRLAVPTPAGQAVICDALFVEACRQHRAGNLKRSKQLFEHVLTLDPGHVNTLCNLGALELKLGDGPRALHLLRTATFAAPDLAPARIALADALRAAQQNEQALAGYRKAIELDPDNAMAHVAYAKALCKVGLEQQAPGDRDATKQTIHDHFRKALALAPKDDAVHAEFAIALHEMGDLDDAMTEFLAATRINQHQSSEFYQALGRTCTARGNLQGAEVSLKHAIALDPQQAGAHCALGDLYLALARPGEAEASFRHALAIDADDAAARRGIERVLREGAATVSASV
jgi:tetratricopeptide (TPR) repeat protein